MVEARSWRLPPTCFRGWKRGYAKLKHPGEAAVRSRWEVGHALVFVKTSPAETEPFEAALDEGLVSDHRYLGHLLGHWCL